MLNGLVQKIGFFFWSLSIAAASETMYVTCNFQGQMGNQMFQIAAAVAYGLDHGYEAIFPAVERAENGILNHRYVFHRLNTRCLPKHSAVHSFKEKHYATYEAIPYPDGKHLCLTGFFQSEKYFLRHAEVIKALFAPQEQILKSIQEKYGAFLREKTVAVHIRTYIPDGRNRNLEKNSAWWNYFIDAINLFPADSLFLIFSDSPSTVKKHFPVSMRRFEFIEGNPHYVDFYLMSLCQHQIVSPASTFSWWAAWLNNNPNKIIIASNVWSEKEYDDAIPSSWIRIKSWPFSD